MSERAGVGDGNDRLRLWLRLFEATRRIENSLRERLREQHGTTLARFDVMAALSRHRDGVTMTELSRALLVSNGNVTGLIDRLEADGLAERRQVAGDRRAIRVRLTGRGHSTFARLARAHHGWIDELLGELDDAEVATLIDPLDRLRKHRT